MTAPQVGRAAVLRYRLHAQGLDRGPDQPRAATDADVLDLGVPDSGTGGALWALANRGAPVTQDRWPDELAVVWSVRGAPHAYRRPDLPMVAAALRPRSPADAAKRVGSAATPLAGAGIPADAALATVGAHLRALVTVPTVKGDVSGRLSAALPGPYVHPCRACGTTHVFELPFRLAALAAGLELEPGTSPPVLRPLPDWPLDPSGTAGDLTAHGPDPDPRLDPVRGYLHHLGPARPADVAAYLDAPTREVTVRWPADAVEVSVDGARRWLLAPDIDALRAAQAEDTAARTADPAATVRLLGPFDPFLQARDRELLVPERAHRSALWPALGRPGAVLAGSELVGTWRPRATAASLRLQLDRWVPWDDALEEAVQVQAERLAAHRGLTLTGAD